MVFSETHWYLAASADRAIATITTKLALRVGATVSPDSASSASRIRPAILVTSARLVSMETPSREHAKVSFSSCVHGEVHASFIKFLFSLLECRCYPGGSKSEQCDSLTGQCLCQDRFTGKHCDRCKVCLQ